MKSVMIDNWVIEDIATLGKNMIYSSGFHKIIEAIILWDKVYYPNNEKSTFWKILTQEQKVEEYLIPCSEDKKIEKLSLDDIDNDDAPMLPMNEDPEDEYDLQKELEAKFDELFGPIDDDN